MSTLALYSKIEGLPESLKKQVLDYIEFLLSRESKAQPTQELKQPEEQSSQFKAGFGGAKGMFSMSPDFDEPLEGLEAKKSSAKKPLKAGFLKGSFVMATDFEDPLEDFKEYMQ